MCPRSAHLKTGSRGRPPRGQPVPPSPAHLSSNTRASIDRSIALAAPLYCRQNFPTAGSPHSYIFVSCYLLCVVPFLLCLTSNLYLTDFRALAACLPDSSSSTRVAAAPPAMREIFALLPLHGANRAVGAVFLLCFFCCSWLANGLAG